METPAVTPQAATAWDEDGNPVQPQQAVATGVTAWDESGNPVHQKSAPTESQGFLEAAGSDIKQAGKGLLEFHNQVRSAIRQNLGLEPKNETSDQSQAALERHEAHKKEVYKDVSDKFHAGKYSEAASRLVDLFDPHFDDPNDPISKALSAQWDSSAQAKERMMESAKSGDTLGTIQHAAGTLPIASQVDSAMTNYQKDQTRENLAHVVTAALPAFVPALMRGAGKVASKTGEAAGELGEQVIKGKNVAQPQAQEALSEVAGVQATNLREFLTEPIAKGETAAKDLYKQIDDASGTDFKTLGQKLQKTNRAIRNSVNDAEEAQLELRRSEIEDTIAEAKDRARAAGVDPAVLDQADAEFKRTSALTDVEKKVFKNVKVVKGNSARGSAETVDIDKAVEELQKLQDNEKYGGPRLEQAFGKDGAKQLLDKLYDAQRQGVHAMKMQKVAKWVAGAIGTAGALEGTKVILSNSGKE